MQNAMPCSSHRWRVVVVMRSVHALHVVGRLGFALFSSSTHFQHLRCWIIFKSCFKSIKSWKDWCSAEFHLDRSRMRISASPEYVKPETKINALNWSSVISVCSNRSHCLLTQTGYDITPDSHCLAMSRQLHHMLKSRVRSPKSELPFDSFF